MARYPNDVDLVLGCLCGCLSGGLKERADVDIKAHVGKCGCDHTAAAVVAVLAHLCHE